MRQIPQNRSVVVCLAAILALPSLVGAQDETPDKESPAGRHVVCMNRNLWEGRAAIKVTAFRLGEDDLHIQVSVKHTMDKPKGNAMLDALYCVNHGVKVRACISGESLLNPDEKDGDGGSMDRETRVSMSTVSFDVKLKPVNPSEGPRDLQTAIRVALTVFEPNLSSRSFAIPITLRALKRSECEYELLADKDMKALIDKLAREREDFEKRLRDALELKDDLETAMMRCEGELSNAVYFLDASKSIEEAFDSAFTEAKMIEDVCGLAELAVGVGKAGLKMLSKHSETVLKALRGKPRHFVGFKRMLAALGEEATPAILKAAGEMDALRVQAAKGLLEDMRNGVNLKDGMKLEKGDAILSGTAYKRFGPDGAAAEGWKGLASDVDIEFASEEMAAHFKTEFTKRVNALLESKGFGKIGEAGELSVNTFVGNLGTIDIMTEEGFKKWAKRLLESDYLENPDAYRTFGAQKSARYYGNFGVSFEPIDGFEIVKENAARADIFWETKNYLDPNVFKDIRKCYERALVGEAIRTGRITRMDKGVKELEDLVNAVKNEDGLFVKASGIAQNKFDRAMAEEMIEKLRKMDGSLQEAPKVASKLRGDACGTSLAVLRADRQGGVAGVPIVSGLTGADLGIKEAARQRAKEIRIPEWIAWATSDTPTAIWTSAGLVEEIVGNPITGALKGYAKLFKWESPPEEELRNARDSIAKAVEALVDPAARGDAERYWTRLCKAVDELRPEELDRLRRQLDATVKKVNEAGKKHPCAECFEIVAAVPLNDLKEDYYELVRYVARIRHIQETFSREEVLRQAREELNSAALDEEFERAKKEYEPLRRMVEGPAQLEEQAGRDVSSLQERQLKLSRDMDEESPEAKKEQEEIRKGWDKVKQMRDEAAALRKQAAEQGPQIANAKAVFQAACAEKQSADDALARLALAWPVTLHFRTIGESLLDRGLANQRGEFPAQALKGYCAEMQMTLRGIRCGEEDLFSRPRHR